MKSDILRFTFQISGFISIVKFLHSLKSYISLKRNKGLYEKIIIFGSNLKIYYNYIQKFNLYNKSDLFDYSEFTTINDQNLKYFINVTNEILYKHLKYNN